MKTTKKIISLIGVAALAITGLFAEAGFGVSGIIGTGIGTERLGSLKETYGDTNGINNMLGGFNIHFHANFGENDIRFAIQPEVAMIFNNGTGWANKFYFSEGRFHSESAAEGSVSVATLNIPLLVGVDYMASEDWMITGLIGPYVDIPLLGKVRTSDGDKEINLNGVTFGVTCDVEASYKIGSGAIIFGGRYNFDLSPIMGDVGNGKEDLFSNRNITCNAGYRFNF